MKNFDPDVATREELVAECKELSQALSEAKAQIQASTLASEQKSLILKTLQREKMPDIPCWGSQPRIKMRTEQ